MWERFKNLSVANLITQGSNVLMYMILARHLSPLDFASFRQVFLIQSVFMTVFATTIPVGLLYFFSRTQSFAGKQLVRGEFLVLSTLVGICVSCLLFLAASSVAAALNNPTLRELLIYSSLAPLGLMAQVLLPSYLITVEKTEWAKKLSAIVAIFSYTPIIFMAWGGVSLEIIVGTLSLIQFSLGLAFFLFTISRESISKILSSLMSDVEDIWAYLWPLMLACSMAVIGLKVDHVVISAVLGVALYGIYSVGAFEVPIFSILQTSMTSVLLPKVTDEITNGNFVRAEKVWALCNRRVAVITFPIAVLFITYADVVIRILFGQQYSSAAIIFSVFTTLVFIRVMHFGLILKALGKTGLEMRANFIYVLTGTIGAAGFTELFGVLGAASWVVLNTFLLGALLGFLSFRATSGKVNFINVYPWREAVVAMISLIFLHFFHVEIDEFAVKALINFLIANLLFLTVWFLFFRAIFYEATDQKVY